MMKDHFILMVNGHDCAEFKSARSGKAAFSIVDCALRLAGVDRDKCIIVLRREYKNV